MTIGEWIERSGRPVPAPFRALLNAKKTVSAEALVQAAERAASVGGAGHSRSRAAAFSLLGADAYITYACLWTVRHGGRSHDLKSMATRVAGGPWRD